MCDLDDHQAKKKVHVDGYIDRICPDGVIYLAETPIVDVEEAFKSFSTREDVSVILITQSIASRIRHLIDGYNKPIPAVLEIPSKDQPYDPSQDSILSRVKFMFGEG